MPDAMISATVPRRRPRRLMLTLQWAVLPFGLLILCWNVQARYTGWHDWNSAAFSYFARNHIEYGLGYTKLFCTWGDAATPPSPPQRYLNHPPLVAIWTAIPLRLFGGHEWAARTVPIAATLGAAWLWMVMLGRLASRPLGVLAGFFYLALPMTAYFGRMVCHEAPVEFFSLLMLHGYFQWSGLYGDRYRRSAGIACYSIGAILGIATGWAAVIMAGIIWLIALPRAFRDGRSRRQLGCLTAIPAVALAAVLLHILWGCGWDFGMFVPLFRSRSFAPNAHGPVGWHDWLISNWEHALWNVTIFIMVPAAMYPIVALLVAREATPSSPLRRVVAIGPAAMPVLATLAQGAAWNVVFRVHSYIHDYWQFLLGPFFAAATASVVLAIHSVLAARRPRLAVFVATLAAAVPLPFLGISLKAYHDYVHCSPEQVEPFLKLAELIPARVPVMVSEPPMQSTEALGGYENRWSHPVIAWYAHRPLIQTTDRVRIAGNSDNCAAYVLTQTPDLADLEAWLTQHYQAIPAGPHRAIYRLR